MGAYALFLCARVATLNLRLHLIVPIPCRSEIGELGQALFHAPLIGDGVAAIDGFSLVPYRSS